KKIIKKVNIQAAFYPAESWPEMETAAKSAGSDEGLIMLAASRGMESYMPQMQVIPNMLNEHFGDKNYLLIYPHANEEGRSTEARSVSNHDDFVAIGKVISKIFK